MDPDADEINGWDGVVFVFVRFSENADKRRLPTGGGEVLHVAPAYPQSEILESLRKRGRVCGR